MMLPSISIKHSGKDADSFQLNNRRKTFTVGSHPMCDLTERTLPSDKMTLLKWSGNKLTISLTPEMKANFVVQNKKHSVEELVTLGLAKKTKDHISLTLKPEPSIKGVIEFGNEAIGFGFKSEEEVPEKYRVANSIYLKARIGALDRRYITVFIVIFLSASWFGNVLYGLPTPVAPPPSQSDLSFRFSKITIPREEIVIPEEQSTDSGPETAEADSPIEPIQTTTRDRLRAKLGGLSNLRSKINLSASRSSATSRKSLVDTNIDTKSDVPKRQLKLRRRFNYQSRLDTQKKEVAEISNLTQKDSRSRVGSSEKASSTLRNHRGRIRQCYENALRTNRSLSGKVYLLFTVNASGGRPSNVRTQPDSGINDPGFLRCLENLIKGIEFSSQPGGAQAMRYPLVFTPSGT